MFSCLQILEAFLWFVLITLLNVTLIILTLSVSRLLNLLLRLVAFLLFLNPQCLASISRWITASSSWKRFCLFVCRALSSIMVICMLTAIRLLTEANPNELNQDDARYGFRCCHLKNIWTAPLPPETELSRQMTTSTTSIDIMGLQAAYANLHTDQERDYFMQRYHDVISSFGGKTSYDADNRPLLVMRSNL